MLPSRERREDRVLITLVNVVVMKILTIMIIANNKKAVFLLWHWTGRKTG